MIKLLTLSMESTVFTKRCYAECSTENDKSSLHPCHSGIMNHIDWNSSKIISQSVSLGCSLCRH